MVGRRAFSGGGGARIAGGLFGLVVASASIGCDEGADVTSSLEVPRSSALAVSDDGVSDPTEVVSAHDDLRRRHDFRSPTAPRDHVSRAPGDPATQKAPLDASDLDNNTCQQAVRLPDGGAVNVATDAARSKGCEQSSYSQRFFNVTVAPGEVVTVTSPSPDAAGSNMWFSSSDGCAPADGACLAGFEWLWGGAAMTNTGRFPVRQVVAVTTSTSCVESSYQLEVRREKLAINASCETALPLGEVVTNQDMAGASVEPSGHGLRRGRYYSVEIPPMTRGKVRVSGSPSAAAYIRKDCSDDIIASSDEISNTTTAMMTAVVVAGPMWSNDVTPLDLALDLTPLAPEADCDQPRVMAGGDSATFDVEGGAQGPASCWCFSPTRVLNVAVNVPAGHTVAVAGLSAADSGATLIELPDSCADACGDNAAFGWGEIPAELRFTNDSIHDQVRHLIVTSNAVWNAEGTSSSFPPVNVTVEVVE